MQSLLWGPMYVKIGPALGYFGGPQELILAPCFWNSLHVDLMARNYMGLSKIMVPFWVFSIIRHLVFLVGPEGDHSFDNHPDASLRSGALT